MKKSITNIFFGVAALSMAVAVGTGLGLADKKEVKPVEAANASGTVTLDLTTNWASANCKVSVYFYDDSNHSGWGNLVSVTAGNYEAEVSYNFDFTPTKMIVIRYDTAATSTGWTKIWNRYPADNAGGMDFGSHIRITDWNSASVNDYAVVKGGISGSAWSDLATLDTVKSNGSKHCEYYATSVNLTSGQAFKVVYGGEYYGYYSIGEGVSASDFSGGSGNDIEINKTGTYSLYFDASTHNVHIANPDFAAADEWAQNFLSTGCTATKSGWSSSASSYSSLSSGAKAYLSSQEHIDHDAEATGYQAQAVQRYDYVLELYGTSSYTDFMGRIEAGKVTPATSRFVIQNTLNDSNSLAIFLAIVASVATIAAVGGYFLLKKKRA